MRNGQNNNKRMRGRSNNNNNNNNNRKGQNPLTRVYESNGPDVKIRGTANHIAEKYIQLARDSQSNGDPVAAENYYQHAEHYYRLIALANEQFRQTQPYFQPGQTDNRSNDPFDDSDDDGQQQPSMGGEPGFVSRDQPQVRENQAYSPREPQPYVPRQDNPRQDNPQRDNQPRDNQQRDHSPREQRDNGQRFNGPRDNAPREHARPPQNHQPQPDAPELGLPSFITGGGSQPQPVVANGPDGFDGQQDRFGLHRRRRRHRGPRPDGAPQPEGAAADAPPSGGPEE